MAEMSAAAILLDAVRQAMQRSDLAAARQCAEQAIALEPENTRAWLALCSVARMQGDFTCAKRALEQAPQRLPEWWANAAQLAQAQGDWPTAASAAREARSARPEWAPMWMLEAAAMAARGDSAGALAVLRQALALHPSVAPLWVDAGEYARRSGDLAAARRFLEKAVVLSPDFPPAWVNLGLVRDELGDWEAAAAAHRKALALDNRLAAAHNGLGAIARAQRDWRMAYCHLAEAVRLAPGQLEYQLNLAGVLAALHEYDAANQTAMALAERFGERTDLLNTRANIALCAAQWDAASALAERSLELNGQQWQPHLVLARAAREQGELVAAQTYAEAAIALAPGRDEPLLVKASILRKAGQFSQAMALCEQALAIMPSGAGYAELATVLTLAGFGEAALAAFDKALERLKNPETISGALFAMAYAGIGSLDKLRHLAVSWESMALTLEQREAARVRCFRRIAPVGRPLVVGYVSGDFRDHVIRHFIAPVLTGHDRTSVRVLLYVTCGIEDEHTQSLKAQADGWRSLVGLSDGAALAAIEADAVDVLVDLSGHTEHNRLELFAHRAAPVQFSWLGFPATVGLTEIDGYLGDKILIPLGMEQNFAEPVVRLPRTWVAYAPPENAPEIRWAPAVDGVVRLGCFNKLAKLSPRTVVLWSSVLRELPQVQLVLKDMALDDAECCEAVWQAFEQYGVERERITLLGRSATPDWGAHMAKYDEIDIALDPVGGTTGGTTTCEALWMGVPLVTLAGDRPGARMSASILAGLGQYDWIVDNEDGYLACILRFAKDLPTLDARRAQREKMRRSGLCDGVGLARALEAVYRRGFDEAVAHRRVFV